MLITIDEIRYHLRLDAEHDSDEDPFLEDMYNSAADYCEAYIEQPLVDSERPTLNPSLRAAILLVIGDLYANREGQFIGKPQADNPQLERLLNTQRKGWGI